MKQREVIDKAIDEKKEEIKTARVGWDGKQQIIRIPSFISRISNITENDKVEFRMNYETKELELKLIRGDKK